MAGGEHLLDGVVVIYGFYLGGKPQREPRRSTPGRGRKGEPKTLKHRSLWPCKGRRISVFRSAVRRDTQRPKAGGIDLVSKVADFG
jgi:hypothetical protein